MLSIANSKWKWAKQIVNFCCFCFVMPLMMVSISYVHCIFFQCWLHCILENYRLNAISFFNETQNANLIFILLCFMNWKTGTKIQGNFVLRWNRLKSTNNTINFTLSILYIVCVTKNKMEQHKPVKRNAQRKSTHVSKCRWR